MIERITLKNRKHFIKFHFIKEKIEFGKSLWTPWMK